ncbi:hypothetical protein N9W34_00415 [Rickettsiales bacterium]|nr:hypothetical protein [Rickettsiales bacterium]
MEQAVLLMAGISMLVFGLSYFFRAKEWDAWLLHTEKRGNRASLVFGSVNLLLGSFIVAFHPVWEGIPLILTIMGILAVCKGFSYLLFPQWLPTKLKYVNTSEKPLLQASGIVFIIISLLFLGSWCIQHDIKLGDIWHNKMPMHRNQQE